jgi:hypothetical protein
VIMRKLAPNYTNSDQMRISASIISLETLYGSVVRDYKTNPFPTMLGFPRIRHICEIEGVLGVMSSYILSKKVEPAVRCMLLSSKVWQLRDLHTNQKSRISNLCQHRKTKHIRGMEITI